MRANYPHKTFDIKSDVFEPNVILVYIGALYLLPNFMS